MKKISIVLLALVSAGFAVSCQKEEIAGEGQKGQNESAAMTITAVSEGIGAGVKSEMAYRYDVLWNENDKICVKNSEKSVEFTLTDGAGTTKGTFTSDESISGEVEAFHPASIENLVWPAVQTSSTVVPMYCKQNLEATSSANFSFTSLGAVLQLVFNTWHENGKLKSITIKDAKKPLSGAFTVSDGVAVITDNEEVPGITYDLGETGKSLGNGANYFNIAVPAGKYENLTITFTATDNNVSIMTGSIDIRPNMVYKLALSSNGFYPEGSKGIAPAEGYANGVRWVQLWKGGPMFAEWNIGAQEASEFGGYYTWGGSYRNGTGIPKREDHYTEDVDLSGSHDTATKLWGENWRMPTKAEYDDLMSKCDYVKTSVNGVMGTKFTGRGDYRYNVLFLPASGWIGGSTVLNVGTIMYWTSTHRHGGTAYYLDIDDTSHETLGWDRNDGLSVRAVYFIPPKTGAAKATIDGAEKDVKWVQLWKSGPKFAEFNVGAKSAAEYGGYYEWGGSIDRPQIHDNNTGSEKLSGDTDTVTKLWGKNWRMPTKVEFDALLSNCDREWANENGMNGLKFTGRGDYSANSIFLPAGGCASSVYVNGLGDYGYYWSSTPDDTRDDCAYSMEFEAEKMDGIRGFRCTSYSLRGVLVE